MIAEVEKDAGEITGADTGIDELGIERRELIAMSGDCLRERFPFFEFFCDDIERLLHGGAVHFAGDKTKALLHGEAGAGELGKLLVEDEEIFAAEGAGTVRRGGLWCGLRFEVDFEQAEGFEFSARIVGANRVDGPGNFLSVV
jgi:hypothetical protein